MTYSLFSIKGKGLHHITDEKKMLPIHKKMFAATDVGYTIKIHMVIEHASSATYDQIGKELRFLP